MATRTSVSGGPFLNWLLAGTWVGGVVPVDGDLVIIPSGSDVKLDDAGANPDWTIHRSTTVKVSGALRLDASSDQNSVAKGKVVANSGGSINFEDSRNEGLLIVEGGGLATLNDSALFGGGRGFAWVKPGGILIVDDSQIHGTVIIESTGAGTFRNYTVNSGAIIGESGSTITCASSFSNQGAIIAEAGSTVTGSDSIFNLGSIILGSGANGAFEFEVGGATNGGFIGYFVGAIVNGVNNGNPAVALGVEKRTTHFTGSLASKILIRNAAQVMYETVTLPAIGDVRLATVYAAGDRTGALQAADATMLAINAKLGTPVVSVSADIAAIPTSIPAQQNITEQITEISECSR